MCHRETNKYKCIEPQRSQRTRRPERDLHSDPKSMDPLGQLPIVEMDQQSRIMFPSIGLIRVLLSVFSVISVVSRTGIPVLSCRFSGLPPERSPPKSGRIAAHPSRVLTPHPGESAVMLTLKPRRLRSRMTGCNLAADPSRRPHPRHLRPGSPTAGRPTRRFRRPISRCSWKALALVGWASDTMMERRVIDLTRIQGEEKVKLLSDHRLPVRPVTRLRAGAFMRIGA